MSLGKQVPKFRRIVVSAFSRSRSLKTRDNYKSYEHYRTSLPELQSSQVRVTGLYKRLCATKGLVNECGEIIRVLDGVLFYCSDKTLYQILSLFNSD